MQTLLHIGLPKTGTSALQKTLRRSYDHLIEHRILYPRNPASCRFASHKILASMVMPVERHERDLRSLASSLEELQDLQRQFVDAVVEQCQEVRPTLLVISAEHLAGTNVQPREMHNFLEAVNSGEVRCVVYCRRPSDHYISRAQQWIKGSHFLPNYHKPIIRIIDAYRNMDGIGEVDVNVFDRRELIDGDIIDDFAGRYFQGSGIDAKSLSRARNANETLSAESMELLLDYRIRFHRDKSAIKSSDSRKLVETLRDADDSVGASRPSFLPGIADRIDYSSKDPLVLRDRFGLEYPDFDYARLERDDLLSPPSKDVALSELLVIDNQRLQEIVNFVGRSEWVETRPQRQWLKSRFRSRRFLGFLKLKGLGTP